MQREIGKGGGRGLGDLSDHLYTRAQPYNCLLIPNVYRFLKFVCNIALVFLYSIGQISDSKGFHFTLKICFLYHCICVINRFSSLRNIITLVKNIIKIRHAWSNPTLLIPFLSSPFYSPSSNIHTQTPLLYI